MRKLIFSFFLVLSFNIGFSQFRPGGSLGNIGNRFGGTGGKSNSDTIAFEHRDDAKDSVTVTCRFVDSIRWARLEYDLNDFYQYYPLHISQQFLGNSGTAAYPLIFKPFAKPGWDAGFHAFDAYRFNTENSRFFKTTKPFTQLGYQLASAKEQVIKVLHTQNPRPNLNFGFEYRLINAPGFFVTQNTLHNNMRFFSGYQGKRKRYAAQFLLIGNTLKSSENGGMQNDSFLTSPNFKRRFTIPTNLGGDPGFDPNPFNTKINTGNIHKDFTFFLRQQYDIGKKDSVIINDSTTEYLFYPKLRFQHTLSYSSHSFEFRDYETDSVIYKNWYDTTLNPDDSIVIRDSWKVFSNDFSLIQFPDTKNPGQYLLAGLKIENISGRFSSGSNNFYNIVAHGEYRNKTKNKKWDMYAKGELYLNGFNSGDYNAFATLSRFLNNRWGNITLLFQNVNRSPSFIYDRRSSFNFKNTESYNKENITIIKASAENPFINLSAANYLITNYTYFSNYRKTEQYSNVINLLQLSASKKIRLTKKWSWYADITLQQTAGSTPIKVPFIFTRSRFSYENLLFKNLYLSTGFEVRYLTGFEANNYSPVMGQFTPQDTTTISNRPDVHAFLHFRIRTFTGYLRAENLNTASLTNGFGFSKQNFAAPHYVYPGLLIRFGILWNFVN